MSEEEMGEGAELPGEVAGEESGDESLWDKAVDWVKDKLGGDEEETPDEGSGYEGGGGETGGGGATDEW